MSEPQQHTLAIENHTVGYVPDRERHGRPRDLFTLWFSTNIAPLPVVSGAMVVQDYHLGLLPGLFAIVLGHALGATVLGLSSAQGPQLGIPQMVQGRGQFGRYGALLMVLITAVIYLGFYISNSVLAGKSIHNLVPAVPLSAGVLVGALAATAIGVIGYRFIHVLNRVGTWVMGTGLLAGFVMVLSQPLPADFFSRGTFNLAGFIATVSLGVVWQISFSPYTSDYSRYLPRSVGMCRPFWATWLGAVGGTVLSFSFGAVVALASAPGADTMAAVQQVSGPLGAWLMLLFLFNIISHNALNLYGAVLTLVTVVQTFFARWLPSVRVKVALSAVVLAGCCAVALGASAGFIGQFIGLVLALLLVLVPWASINLVDFYWVKRGRYDLQSLFSAAGGVYGRFDGHALGAWLVGVLVQLPFANTALFSGPYANLVPGADLSWLVGLAVTVPLYAWLGSKRAAALQWRAA